jgi:hypothetical protein
MADIVVDRLQHVAALLHVPVGSSEMAPSASKLKAPTSSANVVVVELVDVAVSSSRSDAEHLRKVGRRDIIGIEPFCLKRKLHQPIVAEKLVADLIVAICARK